ncbi:TRAP transporter large permease [Vibrio natriegens]|jgi:tripartite ATP-independent transporter DctM subunit|uniref:TRAP transporter large permease protein n=1 Tax=Vibrio natriegens NBRC 15636 = ATCC 14048 = DSM 759 TaxID=1219067 RepID=A0AAN0Y689_VIBNA|nr:TRAP transporter large permease subunit [Vibrio natriegens]ALR18804.1 C4-dicarboxylate ABC transporter permease [Vibrio natriegens NBRC 15636 = ATCC 14048 = DSM 759]ANQ14772.1 C4-dicarboxylate ABC transporter permease [Vibrio natriegens NBRC 15636 = ATCC 14048 = DSM 759]EPM39817.1 C4-dicarboxylate ABC transporter permease [Vibrio natriegens NBRC 15636 = ATCC 14048 = DSM 759]MDX6028260.1 TRAP transporter large permease subunit [Vibrio natriegens NBRC 15636 = ATCC 14048 = DSM 759]UUI13406.1 T
MSEIYIGIISIIVLFTLLASGTWVALSLISVGIVGMLMLGNDSFGLIYATSTWGAVSDWSLAALPLFIWMGEILFRTRLSKDLFEGLTPWLNRVPGALLHVNILSCGMFAAVSGSSAATAATIGKMTLPELKRQGYSDKMSIGTLAGSGTLGLLIPPSIILIVYGVSAEVSIARLFIAGAIPGIMLLLMFVGYTAIWSLRNPQESPKNEIVYSLKDKLAGLLKLVPIIVLVIFVLGSIYAGITTPTEAASFGVLGSLILALTSRTLNWDTFKQSLMGAVKTSCMIIFILAGAAFLTVAMGFIGLPRMLAEEIALLQLSPYMLIICLTILFVILGCFLDGISVVVLTTSVVLPMVVQAGIDPLWFGIYIVLVVEMSQITPPVGFNLFVIQSLTGKNILYIAKAALPFFFVLLAAVIIVTLFPQLVTWLPMSMTQN